MEDRPSVQDILMRRPGDPFLFAQHTLPMARYRSLDSHLRSVVTSRPPGLTLPAAVFTWFVSNTIIIIYARTRASLPVPIARTS